MNERDISIVVAMANNRVIGNNGKLPWKKLKRDMDHFKDLTIGDGSGNIVIMGRKTFESIPSKWRPLEQRRNFVLTNNPNLEVPDGCVLFGSLMGAIVAAGNRKTFIMGGARVYKEALSIVDRMFVTLVHADLEGDTFFPEIDASEWDVEDEGEVTPIDDRNQYPMSFHTYTRKK